MDNVTWQTYDWSQHSTEHYKEEQMFYAPLLAARSPGSPGSPAIVDRIGLIRTHASNKWQLPIGSSLRDNEKKEDAVMRAFCRMFDDKQLNLLIFNSSGINDNLFTCDASESDYRADTLTSSTYDWTEDELNKHIARCIVAGERPRWNKPGPTNTCTEYYVVNVGDPIGGGDVSSIGGMTVGYVRELAFFTREEITDLYRAGVVDSLDYTAIDDYFASKHDTPKPPPSSREYQPQWSNSAMDACHMTCACIALEIAVALFACMSYYV